MNLCDTVVERVLSINNGMWGWEVKVSANSWGSVFEHTIIVKTEQDALEIKPGYRFLS